MKFPEGGGGNPEERAVRQVRFLTISPPSESVPTGVIFIFKELLDNLF